MGATQGEVPPQPVGILGGMGPAAGADFVKLFVDTCTEHLVEQGQPVTDQAYPEHWLAQLPIPDRSTALRNPATGGHQPGEPLKQAVGRMAALGVRHVAMVCNTAHAWHEPVQQAFPAVRILNAMTEVARSLAARQVSQVGLLATQGTYSAGLYQRALGAHGIACVVPNRQERATLMRGIYDGVKAGDMKLAAQCFTSVARALSHREQLGHLIMGCTEIPLALRQARLRASLTLVDPAQVLARRLVACAYG